MSSEPLFVLAQKKALGPLQIMDRETLTWIKRESANYIESIHLELLTYETIPKIPPHIFDLIKKLTPHKESFFSHEHYKSIHGISHITRVLYITALIAMLVKDGINISELLVVASIHDLRRRNDNEDPGHGGRSFKWLRGNLEKYDWAFDINDKDKLESIKHACVFHQINYEKIPIRIYEKYHYFIDLFKSADALDRFRQPKSKWWPNPEHIRFKQALPLLQICADFTILTEQHILDSGDEHFIPDIIHTTAKKLFST